MLKVDQYGLIIKEKEWPHTTRKQPHVHNVYNKVFSMHSATMVYWKHTSWHNGVPATVSRTPLCVPVDHCSTVHAEHFIVYIMYVWLFSRTAPIHKLCLNKLHKAQPEGTAYYRAQPGADYSRTLLQAASLPIANILLR